MKKLTIALIAFYLSGSLLFSQDLVKAAQKEKERRAQLKKKSGLVVTNFDLYEKGIPPEKKSAPPKTKSQTTPRTAAVKPQTKIPVTPTPSQKKLPSQQIENLDQIDLRVDKIDLKDRSAELGFNREYATQVLEATEHVQNPQMALDKPDGKFAHIGEFGSLVLEIDIRNGAGDDIAVYAKRQQEGHQNENRNYGVFVEHKGEWEFIGFGGGINSPEKFDLGTIQSANKVLLLFKDFTQSMMTTRPYEQEGITASMAIDAVHSLHK